MPLAPTRVCQNSAAGGFDKPPRLMSRPTVRSEDSLSALLLEAVSVYGPTRGRPLPGPTLAFRSPNTMTQPCWRKKMTFSSNLAYAASQGSFELACGM